MQRRAEAWPRRRLERSARRARRREHARKRPRLARARNAHREHRTRTRADDDDRARRHGATVTRSATAAIIFLLADSTFAFACNSYNRNTVAQGCSIDYLAPAHAGDVLHATGVERVPDRSHRRLRHRRAQPGRQDGRAVSRQELSDRRARRRRAVGTASDGEQRHAGQSDPDPAISSRSRRASRDELAALQLERLQWTLRHAYDNVAHYRQSVR